MRHPTRRPKQHATAPRPAAAALLAAALALGACGGGGGPGSGGGGGAGPDPTDPRVVRLGALLERADTLRMSGLHARWSLSAEGEETIEDAYVESVTCAGARCVTADGTATTVRDLAGASSGTGTAGTELGTRGGFDTASARGGFAVSETLDGVAVTAKPAVTTWGFWGDHGFAALALGAGEVMAEIGGTAFEGTFSMAQVWALGDATGTNPVGTGSATWTGIAEASPTGTFERLQGTATVTIADLSRPRVGVAVDVPGHDIGAPGWADMPIADGAFASGTAGTDYLAGAFHGPGHEEAWGVFDTANHVGAFGARRTP